MNHPFTVHLSALKSSLKMDKIVI
jgi:hypothetical protein